MNRVVLPFMIAASLAAAGAPSLPGALAQQKPKQTEAEKKAEKPLEYRLGDLTLRRIWSHSSVTRNGAAFLKIRNASEDDDALIDASTPVAKRIELHGPSTNANAWRTARVDEIPTPAKLETSLTGTTLHLKLIGLRGPLKAGEDVPITLTFERAGAITVKARVLAPDDAAKMIENSATRKTKPARKRRKQ